VRVFQFSLKTGGYSLSVVWPQNQGQWFDDLGIKITVMVSWFGAQKQV
jgi:hypothetical protein